MYFSIFKQIKTQYHNFRAEKQVSTVISTSKFIDQAANTNDIDHTGNVKAATQ